MPIASDQAVEILNPKGESSVVILCEHASNHIPARYRDLGLTPEDRISHAAWDPGALAVARHLSAALDAPVVASCVSRLVYDCNRPPESPGAIAARSEYIDVPGNQGLTEDQRQERVASVYRPFCAAVDRLLGTRAATGRQSVIVTIHSFTPVYFGTPRTVDIGILHDADARLADAMLSGAPALPHRRIARNDPYGPEDGVTHSLILHGLRRGLANVMIEVRNDLIAEPFGVAALSDELLQLLRPALADVLSEEVRDD